MVTVVTRTRCCLNRVDRGGKRHGQPSLSSHPDALRRRQEAEARRRRRRTTKQQRDEGGGGVKKQTTRPPNAVAFLESSPSSSVGQSMFEQALNWVEKSGLFDDITARSSKQLNNLESLRAKIESSGTRIVVTEFTAPWCRACDKAQNKMRELYRRHEDVTFVRINAKDSLQLCRDLGVKKLPWYHVYTSEEEEAASSNNSNLSLPKFTTNSTKRLAKQINILKYRQIS